MSQVRWEDKDALAESSRWTPPYWGYKPWVLLLSIVSFAFVLLYVEGVVVSMIWGRVSSGLWGFVSRWLQGLWIPGPGYSLGVCGIATTVFVAVVFIDIEPSARFRGNLDMAEIQEGVKGVASWVILLCGVVMIRGLISAALVWGAHLFSITAFNSSLPGASSIWSLFAAVAMCVVFAFWVRPGRAGVERRIAETRRAAARLTVLVAVLRRESGKNPGTGCHSFPLAGANCATEFILRRGWLIASGAFAGGCVVQLLGYHDEWWRVVRFHAVSIVVLLYFFAMFRRFEFLAAVRGFLYGSEDRWVRLCERWFPMTILSLSGLCAILECFIRLGVFGAVTVALAWVVGLFVVMVLLFSVRHGDNSVDDDWWPSQATRMRLGEAFGRSVAGETRSALVIHDYYKVSPQRVERKLASRARELSRANARLEVELRRVRSLEGEHRYGV